MGIMLTLLKGTPRLEQHPERQEMELNGDVRGVQNKEAEYDE